MSDQELQQQMDAMRALKEPMPQIGIFWFDLADKVFFGVRKQEVTPKQVEEAAENGIPFINYPHLHRQVWAKEYFRAQVTGEQTKFVGDYTQIPRGRVTWSINKFIVWDLGHGWSGDL